MKVEQLFLMLIALFLTSCSTQSNNSAKLYQFEDETVLTNLDSVEYKILLKPELLTDTSGYGSIWSILEQVAQQQNITTELEKEPFKIGYRNIQYLDTGNLELRSKGYTLRYRQKYNTFAGFKDPTNKLGEKYDVTLKYRNSDQENSLQTVLSVGKKRFAKEQKEPELEADITSKGIIYSRAIKLKLKEKKHGTFANLFDYSINTEKGYATMFPELSKLKMHGTAIIPVADTTIIEAKVEPGKLVFSKNLKPEVAISLFYNSFGNPIVAEVSFDFDIEEKKHTVSFDELKQIEGFYTALLQNLGDDISTGTTKTAYVYKLEN